MAQHRGEGRARIGRRGLRLPDRRAGGEGPRLGHQPAAVGAAARALRDLRGPPLGRRQRRARGVFIAAVRSTAGRRVLKRFGFGLPPRGPERWDGLSAALAMALCIGVALTFLALPLVALFTEVPLHRRAVAAGRPDGAGRARASPPRTNAVANVLILAFGTPTAWFLATRRFRGRALVVTLVELPLVLPPAVAGIGLLAAFGVGGLVGPALQDAGIVLPFSSGRWSSRSRSSRRRSTCARRSRRSRPSIPRSWRRRARSAPARARTFARSRCRWRRAGWSAGWVLAFARGVGEFGATIIFAGNVHGKTQTLTLAVYEELDSDFDVALAIGILLVVLSALILISYKLLSSWRGSTSTSLSPFARSPSTSR